MTRDAERPRHRVRAGLRSRADARLPAVSGSIPAARRADDQSLPTRLDRALRPLAGDGAVPAVIKDVYVATARRRRPRQLQRFDPATRVLEPVDWPASLAPIRAQLADTREDERRRAATLVVRIDRRPPIWEQRAGDRRADRVPAARDLQHRGAARRCGCRRSRRFATSSCCSIADYIDRRDAAGAGASITSSDDRRRASTISSRWSSQRAGGAGLSVHAGVRAGRHARADATAELFQVRPQDFAQLVAEVRRFTALTRPAPRAGTRTVTTFTLPIDGHGLARPGRPRRRARDRSLVAGDRAEGRPRQRGRPVGAIRDRGSVAARRRPRRRRRRRTGGCWSSIRPARSRRRSTRVRRRNLLVSTSILGVLGASMGLLVLSTRRAQQLARQQMEFVATVSHELRTPLAVIRSAADNLADGVVHDEAQDPAGTASWCATEGRRLTEMVEQILEFAGIQSGQRTFAPRAGRRRRRCCDDVVAASSGRSIEAARHRRSRSTCRPTCRRSLGDEPALRPRVSEPDRQRDQVRRRRAAGSASSARRSGIGGAASRVADRGIGIDAGGPGADLRAVLSRRRRRRRADPGRRPRPQPGPADRRRRTAAG